ncbi:MAG: alpha-2-macroglobulin family protein, partial [Bacteroidales bacterium]
YSLNDSIRVTGKVENYAGNPVTHADISFRVTRNSYWPFPYRDYRWIPPYTKPEVQIAFGELTTDDQGKFSLKFKAAPDASEINEINQFYQFNVSIQAADITGEVHDAQTSIRVGSVSAILEVKGQDQVSTDAGESFTISASNLSGAAVRIEAKATYYQLEVPDKLLFSTPFGEPDVEVISETSYRDQFPDLAWKEKNSPQKMSRKEMSGKDFIVDGKTTLSLDDLKSWPIGEYVLVVEGKDQYGKTVKSEHYFSLYSLKSKTIPGKPANWVSVSTKTAEPGENMAITVGSAARKARMLVEVSHGTETLFSQWVNLSGGLRTFEIPVKESHRGGLQVNTCMVLNNHLFTEQFIIDVPFTNKKLDIVLETHRDFLIPGKKETWQVNVKGADGNALSARLMAGMYDASLDQFTSHSWEMSLYGSGRQSNTWMGKQFQTESSRHLFAPEISYLTGFNIQYPDINWFGYIGGYPGLLYERSGMINPSMSMKMSNAQDKVEAEDVDELNVISDSTPKVEDKNKGSEPNIPLRTNFNETAFFYPDLSTDEEGNVLFSFDTPDALTTWKLMMLAYTPDLKTGTSQEEFKAKKSLMVMPNVPRFVRQNDELDFTGKVVNMTDVSMKAVVTVEFFDPLTGNTVDLSSDGSAQKQELQILPGQGTVFTKKIIIPNDLQMLGIRTTASDGTHTDGEERVIPVLTNRVLVTETMPMNVKANSEKSFEFLNLVNTARMMRQTSKQNYRFTVEFTSNPAWYAIQALPAMSEPVSKSTLSVFNRYMANGLSSFIVNSNPIIKQVFDSWRQHSPKAFLSNLQKNEDLKNVVLSATPWVLEAEDEATQKQRIASLFDLNQLAREKEKTMELLRDKQLSTGAWPWFDGMRDDRYTTQAIVLGIAKLDNKGVLDLSTDAIRLQMVKNAVVWLDKEIADEYDDIKRNFPKSISDNHLSGNTIQYLYARSLLLKYFPIPQTSQQAVDYFVDQSRSYWLKQSNYLQGMLALALPEFGFRNDTEAILRSLMERALVSDEMGMYWRQISGWNWYEAPVETQAMMIEAFSKLQKNLTSVDQMKMWLLKQKQTSKWNTSSATAEAVYALLMTDGNMLDENVPAEVTVGGQLLDNKSDQGQTPEAGTGYFSKTWSQEAVSADLGEIKVKNPNNHVAWGAAYWQYFENIDQVIKQQTSLSVDKQLFIETNTDQGQVLVPVEKNQVLKTGDKLVVRLVVKTDRNLEFVHLSDMRATGLEPISNLSGYMYSGGLGYYHQITDVGSDFFIRFMQKGTFVLEYGLYVTQKGTFVNGMATIQSMYAPEFAAHSAGGKVVVE